MTTVNIIQRAILAIGITPFIGILSLELFSAKNSRAFVKNVMDMYATAKKRSVQRTFDGETIAIMLIGSISELLLPMSAAKIDGVKKNIKNSVTNFIFAP